jgi:hypothetical protein
MKERGFSEREVCMRAGITKTTWRRATGRNFPSDPNAHSLLSLRDFIAAALVLRLDPVRVLGDALVLQNVRGDKKS